MTYNIVFIMPDQLRADFVGCYGADFVSTPHIDELSKQGVRYTRALSPAPLCVPARASLLTGMNSIRNGVLDNGHWLRPDRKVMGISTWAEDLKEAGYRTAAIGKMHFYPWDISEGFDYRMIAEDKRHIGIQDDYAKYLASYGLRKLHGNEHDGYYENKGAVESLIPLKHQVDGWVAEEAVKFFENYDDDAPFAMMVGLPSPHCPYDPPSKYMELYQAENMPDSIPSTPESAEFRADMIAANLQEWNGIDYTDFSEFDKKNIRAHYAGLVTLIDDCVGRIIDGLKHSGKFDNTIIIFTSDHGDFLGDYDLIGKYYFFEKAMHVPLIISHPEQRQSSVVDNLVSLTDVIATIRQFANIDVRYNNNDSLPLPGLQQSDNMAREYIFGATSEGFMITTDEWKVCRYHNGQTALYHIYEDPHEQHNLINDQRSPLVLQKLDRLMQAEILNAIRDSVRDRMVNPELLDPTSYDSQPGSKRPYPFPITQ